MANPYKSSARSNDPKWMRGVQKFADGGGAMRSESAEYARAQQHINKPEWREPVTALEGLVGRFSESKGRDNALRDAVREKDTKTMQNTGYDYPMMAKKRGGRVSK